MKRKAMRESSPQQQQQQFNDVVASELKVEVYGVIVICEGNKSPPELSSF